MLTAIEGYYNGQNIVTDEKIALKKGQKVIITILNDVTAQPENRQIDLSGYMGRGPRMFHGNAADYVKDLRSNDRL